MAGASLYGRSKSACDLPATRARRLAYLQAIGFQDRAKTIPMQANSIFWIASMTKPVTSVAAMILVDEGKLELDAPVAAICPSSAR